MKSWPINLLFNYFLLRNVPTELNEVVETIELLMAGESQIEIHSNYRDVVLLIGNQGTGKSTLSLYISGKLSDLIAIDGNDDDFIIESESTGWINHEQGLPGTIYPNFIIDEKNVAFYDCPGFNSTRLSVEIAGKYYLKKVVDHSNSLKLVLVADYESVQYDGSTTAFHELVKNVYLFVNHISSYRDGFSFVVTKVEHDETEGTAINGIANFLKKYRDEITAKPSSDFNNFATVLVDILLQRNGKSYDKISLFFKPDSAGPLKNIKYMVDGRKKIRDMISRTKYVNKTADDFAYTISSTSNAKLVSLGDTLNSEIKKNIQKIGGIIEFELQSEAARLGNLIQLVGRFENVHSRISAIRNASAETLNAAEVVAMLTNAAKEVNVLIPLELFDNVQYLDGYIAFLQFFSTELQVKTSEWMDGLQECVYYLDRSKHWFTYLSSIYEKFSHYNIEADLSDYKATNISRDNFWPFYSSVNIGTTVYENFPNQFELQALNDLIQITVRDSIDIICDQQMAKMTVKGHYVRLTEVNLNHCRFSPKLLYIYATHTVFFDANFTTNNMNIVIVSPTWYVVGNSKFTLAGIAGVDIDQSAKPGDFDEILTKVVGSSSDLNRHGDGEPGVPGHPGGPAFNFLGMGKYFINGIQLEVSCKST